MGRLQGYGPGVVKHWNTLPSKVDDALCLPVFKRHLDNALNDVLSISDNPEAGRQLDLIFVDSFHKNESYNACYICTALNLCNL